MGNYEKAELLYLDSKSILEKALGKEHIDYAANLQNLGLLYMAMDKYEKAEPIFLEAKSIQEKSAGQRTSDGYAMILAALGHSL